MHVYTDETAAVNTVPFSFTLAQPQSPRPDHVVGPQPAQQFSLDTAYRQPQGNVYRQPATSRAMSYGLGPYEAGAPPVMPVTAQFQQQHGPNGVPSEALQHVEIISPQLRRDIVKGKDINLCSLLIPGYNPDNDANRHLVVGGEVVPLKPLSADGRLSRALTISDFVQAFTVFKNIMCEAFPQRRVELDSYLREIIDMSSKFGGTTFYEYHKSFSARAAALLLNYNIKVDWSRRDNNQFCSIFAGHKANSCSICNSISHTTEYCGQAARNVPGKFSNQNKRQGQTEPNKGDSDLRGRPRIHFQGREIRNNFNSASGCTRENCYFSHVCLRCKKDHPASQCHLPSTPKQFKKDVQQISSNATSNNKGANNNK